MPTRSGNLRPKFAVILDGQWGVASGSTDSAEEKTTANPSASCTAREIVAPGDIGLPVVCGSPSDCLNKTILPPTCFRNSTTDLGVHAFDQIACGSHSFKKLFVGSSSKVTSSNTTRAARFFGDVPKSACAQYGEEYGTDNPLELGRTCRFRSVFPACSGGGP